MGGIDSTPAPLPSKLGVKNTPSKLRLTERMMFKFTKVTGATVVLAVD